MSDTDLELLITLDDPPYGPDEDRFDHHLASSDTQRSVGTVTSVSLCT